jgi:hypothetical protein
MSPTMCMVISFNHIRCHPEEQEQSRICWAWWTPSVLVIDRLLRLVMMRQTSQRLPKFLWPWCSHLWNLILTSLLCASQDVEGQEDVVGGLSDPDYELENTRCSCKRYILPCYYIMLLLLLLLMPVLCHASFHTHFIKWKMNIHQVVSICCSPRGQMLPWPDL